MIRTKVFTVAEKIHCSYCGEEAQSEWSRATNLMYHFCACKDALKEQYIKIQISDLEAQMPRENKEIQKRLQFEEEVKHLRLKYGIIFEDTNE